MKKTFTRQIQPHVELHCDPKTGLAWIEDGRTGSGLSLHPNIDDSGSVTGMKNRGYWGRDDRCVRSYGTIYNIDKYVPEDDKELNQILLENCKCGGNHG